MSEWLWLTVYTGEESIAGKILACGDVPNVGGFRLLTRSEARVHFD